MNADEIHIDAHTAGARGFIGMKIRAKNWADFAKLTKLLYLFVQMHITLILVLELRAIALDGNQSLQVPVYLAPFL